MAGAGALAGAGGESASGGMAGGGGTAPVSPVCAKVGDLCTPESSMFQCCATQGRLIDSTKECWSDFLECAQFPLSKECVWGEAGTCLFREIPGGYQILRTVDTPLTGEAEPLGFVKCTAEQTSEMGQKLKTLPKCP